MPLDFKGGYLCFIKGFGILKAFNKQTEVMSFRLNQQYQKVFLAFNSQKSKKKEQNIQKINCKSCAICWPRPCTLFASLFPQRLCVFEKEINKCSTTYLIHKEYITCSSISVLKHVIR